jgi:hypothetical protein
MRSETTTMTRTVVILSAVALGASYASACSSHNANILCSTDCGDGGAAEGGGSSSGTIGQQDADGGVPNAPPHAQGTILLGEAHTKTTAPTPIVSASFVPDTSATKSCTTQVGGCDVVTAPSCDAPCPTGQACAWDDGCKPVCKDVCSANCSTDQECYFPSPGQSACRTRETFEAGVLAFSGTTTPITLYPPYSYQSKASGAPFLAGAQIEVQGSGAPGAGFDAFDEKFTATTFLQTTQALADLDPTLVFGTTAVPINWVPGADAVKIVLTGLGGSVTCPASDASGHFDIPRTALQAAMKMTAGAQSLSITVARQRDERRTNEKTHGTLSTAKVQPVAWLDLLTQSSESASFQGCPSPDVMCGSSCVDLTSDRYNCGTCSHTCPAGQACSGGQCGCTTLLIDDMESGSSSIPHNCGRQGNWFTFNDATSGGVQTPSVPSPVVISGGRGSSLHAAESQGHGFTNWGAGFGVTVNTPPGSSTPSPYNANAYKGITFWAHVTAGTTASVRVMLPISGTDPSGGKCSPSSKCDDHYSTTLTFSSTWTQYTVLFSQLAQQGFGTPVSWDPTQLLGVQFQVGPSTTFDVWIDDIAFVQ